MFPANRETITISLKKKKTQLLSHYGHFILNILNILSTQMYAHEQTKIELIDIYSAFIQRGERGGGGGPGRGFRNAEDLSNNEFVVCLDGLAQKNRSTHTYTHTQTRNEQYFSSRTIVIWEILFVVYLCYLHFIHNATHSLVSIWTGIRYFFVPVVAHSQFE